MILATNLNSYGSVDVELPPDVTGARGRMVSHPLGLAFYDPDSGASVLLAQLQDCSAQIVSNKIVFANAFAGSNGIEGSIIYSYGVGRFHQDVLLTTRPSVTPADFGMGENARLEMLTEIVQSPEPVITEKTLSASGSVGLVNAGVAPAVSGVTLATVFPSEQTSAANSATSATTGPVAEPVLTDQTIRYSVMEMTKGRAFSTANQTASPQNGLTVMKQLVSMDNRTVLTEDVLWNQAVDALQTLPLSRDASTAPQASAKRALPRQKMIAQMNTPSLREKTAKSFTERLAEAHRAQPLKLAALNSQRSTLNQPSGFVMDYELVQTCSSFTFQSGHTYLISDTVDMSDAEFQSGSVLKYAGGGLRLNDPPTCPDYYDAKAVITDMNDDSVGEMITNSVHHFTGYHSDCGLDLSQAYWDQVNLQSLDIRFVGTGVFLGPDQYYCAYVVKCWFFGCDLGIDAGTSALVIYQDGFCNVGTPYSTYYASDYDYNDFCESGSPYYTEYWESSSGYNTTCAVDRNTNGLPDAWEFQYLASLTHSGSELDYSDNGYTFAQDYTNNISPTVFAFTGIEVVNNYVRSNLTAMQLNVAGSPYYVAVSVDHTNYASGASWQVFTGTNVTVNLGSTQGWHDVWIGLRGYADNSSRRCGSGSG
jgi:hypothetical protein